MYAHLGQAARCPSSSVLPPDYLDGDDVAYLPGIAPEPPAPPAPEAPGWPWVAAAGGAVLLAWWLLRH